MKTVSKSNSLYEVLGCYPIDSIQVIKAAYRKLSLKHHPDRGGDADKFLEITEAFSVLSDSEQRERYDTTGEYSFDARPEGRVESEIALVAMEAFLSEGNPVDWMLKTFDRRRAECQSARGECNAILKKLETQLETFKHENESTQNSEARDFISQAIEIRIQEVNLGIVKATDDIDHLTNVIAYLNGLSCKSSRNNSTSSVFYGRGFQFGAFTTRYET